MTFCMLGTIAWSLSERVSVALHSGFNCISVGARSAIKIEWWFPATVLV